MHTNDVLKPFCSFESIPGKFIKTLLWDLNKEFVFQGNPGPPGMIGQAGRNGQNVSTNS